MASPRHRQRCLCRLQRRLRQTVSLRILSRASSLSSTKPVAFPTDSTTTDLTTSWAAFISSALGLDSPNKPIELLTRAVRLLFLPSSLAPLTPH